MTNDEFRKYIFQRLGAARKAITDPASTPEQVAAAKAQVEVLEPAAKMARHSSGPEFRRFRRDFERRRKMQ